MLLTFSAGPAQTWYAWKLAHPSIKQHRRWFVLMLISSLVFYTEAKNIVGRTAHIKELMRERKWKVTPRTGIRVRGDGPRRAGPIRECRHGSSATGASIYDNELEANVQAIYDHEREGDRRRPSTARRETVISALADRPFVLS
ncbi:MAG: hypothetical protein ABIP17_09465 [Ilumatobacteraceae bacterium]